VDITTGDIAGFVFDRYDADNYKFVALNVTNDQVIIGHATSDDGVVFDATFFHDLDSATAHRLKLTMQGAGIGIDVDGTTIASYGLNAALVDGGFGLFSFDGTTTFDSLTVRTNDSAFASDNLIAANLPSVDADDVTIAESGSAVNLVLDAAIDNWTANGLLSATDLARLEAVTIEVVDLPGMTLGRAAGDIIYIDTNAAGHGWFIDKTPDENEEYHANGNQRYSQLAVSNSEAYASIDLLTVVEHEMGHVLGHSHTENGLMDDELQAGERKLIATEVMMPASSQKYAVSTQKDLGSAKISYFDELFGAFKQRETKADSVDAAEFMVYKHQHNSNEGESVYQLRQEHEANQVAETLTEESSSLIDWSAREG